jgi:hypothetical protein
MDRKIIIMSIGMHEHKLLFLEEIVDIFYAIL